MLHAGPRVRGDNGSRSRGEGRPRRGGEPGDGPGGRDGPRSGRMPDRDLRPHPGPPQRDRGGDPQGHERGGRERGRGGGSIVLLQSISVKQPLDNLILSNAMRGAVLGLAKSLARELAKDSIRVNVVAPGYVGTDRLLEVVRARAEKEGVGVEATTASMAREIPLGRFGA